MNQDVTTNLPQESEPIMGAGGAYLPMWITALLGILFYWGCYYVDEHGGRFNQLVYAPYTSTNELASVLPADENAARYKMGEQVYATCAQCHQPTGAGAPGIAPPLAGSEWVHMAPSRVIRIPLRGLTGPITVKGTEFNLNMVGFEPVFNDEQIAAVLTYVRRTWGNNASPITPSQVKKVRADIQSHPDPFTADELKKLPETE